LGPLGATVDILRSFFLFFFSCLKDPHRLLAQAKAALTGGLSWGVRPVIGGQICTRPQGFPASTNFESLVLAVSDHEHFHSGPRLLQAGRPCTNTNGHTGILDLNLALCTGRHGKAYFKNTEHCSLE
jgi:hypothetical protein